MTTCSSKIKCTTCDLNLTVRLIRNLFRTCQQARRLPALGRSWRSADKIMTTCRKRFERWDRQQTRPVSGKSLNGQICMTRWDGTPMLSRWKLNTSITKMRSFLSSSNWPEVLKLTIRRVQAPALQTQQRQLSVWRNVSSNVKLSGTLWRSKFKAIWSIKTWWWTCFRSVRLTPKPEESLICSDRWFCCELHSRLLIHWQLNFHNSKLTI